MQLQHSKPKPPHKDFWSYVAVAVAVWFIALTFLTFGFSGCSEHDLDGMASYYSNYYHGRLTASGVVFHQEEMYAAHLTLPFGTMVRVFSEVTNDSCDVMVVDRGPYVNGRVIDVSLRAARELKMLDPGLIPVRLRVLDNKPLPTE